MQSAARQTDRDIGNLAKNSERSAGRIGSSFMSAGKAIAIGFGAVAAVGLARVGTGFLMANANAEQYMMSLETVTGSQAKANALFKDLQTFAKETPFEFPELVQSAIQLESFGLKTNDWIGTIGDTASAMGKSVNQVTEAVLDATSGQYERLKELGIQAGVEGDKLRLSYMENGEQITELVDKNNKQIIASTIQGIWNKKYEGAMKKQSKTFNGQLSTLKDNINMTMQDATKPIFEFAKNGLDAANRFFDRFNDKRAQGFSVWESGLRSLHTTLNQTLGRAAGDAIIGTIRGIGDAVGAVVGGIGTLVGDLAAGDFGAFFTDLGNQARALASAGLDLGTVAVKALFDLGAGVVTDIWNWFKSKIGWHNALQVAAAGLAFGGIGVVGYLVLGDDLQRWAGQLGEWLKPQLMAGWDKIVDLGRIAISMDWGAVARDLDQKWRGALNSVKWDELGQQAGAATRALVLKGAELVAGLVKGITDNWQTIGKVLAGLVLGLPAAIGYLGYTLIPKAAEFLAGFVRGLDINWSLIGDWLASLPGKIIAAIPSLASALVSKGGEIITGLVNGLNEQLPTMTAWLSLLSTIAVAAVGYLGTTLAPKAAEFVKGFVDGLDINWSLIGSWLSALPGRIVGAIEGQASALMAAGKLVVLHFWNGLKADMSSSASSAGNAFKASAASLVNGIVQGVLERIDQVRTLGRDIVIAIVAGLVIPVATFAAKGAEMINGIVTGLNETISTMTAWLSLLPTLAVAAVGDLTTTLLSKGVDLLISLVTGLNQTLPTLTAWLGSLGPIAVSAVGDLSVTLLNQGVQLISGLISGLNGSVGQFTAWLGSIPGIAAGAVGDLSGVLFGAGQSLVSGLISGIDSMIGALTSKLGWLTSLIPANKGPISKDRVLLEPAGKAIMQGLIGGINAQVPNLVSTLQGITRGIGSPQFGYAGTMARASYAGSMRNAPRRSSASYGATYIIQGDLLGQRDWERRVNDLAERGAVTVIDRRSASERAARR